MKTFKQMMASKETKISLGAACVGLASGYLVGKASRLVTLTAGGCVLIFQIMEQAEIIPDWNSETATTIVSDKKSTLTHTAEYAMKSVAKLSEIDGGSEETKRHLQTSFIGGMLLGFGIA
ncbi:hypothetical protein SNEBB_010858 [Seison nebaliae]|nr:hypothetical protein SNEBB_010858 [Seison nebaliae]